MSIAWALLAVSSERQAGTLKHQRAWAEGVCAEKGWTLSRCIEGVASGKAGPRQLSRDLLLEMRATPIEARPSYVLLIRLDRVGRGSIVDSQLFVRDLFQLGARLFTRDQGEIRLDSAMDELIAAVQLAVARHENDVRSDKARALYKRRRDAGQVTSNRAPYGLRLTASRQYEARPEYVACIRKAFRMLADGQGMMDVVRWLQHNSEPHRYKNGKEYAVRWSDRRLAIMVAHRGYRGTIVNERTWLRAQRPRLTQSIGRAPKRNRQYTEFVLADVFRCSCGRRISYLRAITPKGVVHRYYVCRASWTHRKAWYHVADRLEATFRVFLERLAADPFPPPPLANERHLVKLDAAIQRLRRRIEAVEVQRQRIWHLDDLGRLTVRDLEERMLSLNERKRSIEAALVTLLEERAHLGHLTQHDAEVERIRVGALRAYLIADDLERNRIARAVSATFGGLRVTFDGRILKGPKPDQVWLRKKTHFEI